MTINDVADDGQPQTAAGDVAAAVMRHRTDAGETEAHPGGDTAQLACVERDVGDDDPDAAPAVTTVTATEPTKEACWSALPLPVLLVLLSVRSMPFRTGVSG